MLKAVITKEIHFHDLDKTLVKFDKGEVINLDPNRMVAYGHGIYFDVTNTEVSVIC
jgi:hypothetical protein